MKDWLLEVWMILASSRKTQWAIIIGLVGYMIIGLIGDYMLSDFQFSGILAPMSGVVKDNLQGKYDKAALGFLVSCWWLAIKLYRKDKKRLYGYR